MSAFSAMNWLRTSATLGSDASAGLIECRRRGTGCHEVRRKFNTDAGCIKGTARNRVSEFAILNCRLGTHESLPGNAESLPGNAESLPGNGAGRSVRRT